ncbi:MAG: GWxTD domain-containing protein [bacterium]
MKYFFILILFCSALLGQTENIKPNIGYNFTPTIFLDIANYKADTGTKTKVDVFMQVPYSSLQFLKSNNLYQAKYSITLTIFDEDKENIVFERIWTEKITSNEFEETQSRLNYNISYQSIELESGEYLLNCFVEDLDSKKTMNIESPIEVKKFDEAISISDIIFIREIVSDQSGERIIPNISHMVTSMDKQIKFFYEIYSDTDSKVILRYLVNNKDEEEIASSSTNYNLTTSKNVVFAEVENTNFSLGDYQLTLNVQDTLGNTLAQVNKVFKSKIFGFPGSIEDLDKAVDEMVYIASTNDIDSIQSAETFEEKLVRFTNYWKSKDPSPNTIENEVLLEYYRRVDFSNENFKSYLEGWRTDMGMIYITLGPPNAVERRPFELESKPYEMWDYYDINKRFVFVDQTGFGDYRLISPMFGEWYRYRY